MENLIPASINKITKLSLQSRKHWKTMEYVGKQGESEENIEKHGETRRIKRKHTKTWETREKRTENTGKQGESGKT